MKRSITIRGLSAFALGGAMAFGALGAASAQPAEDVLAALNQQSPSP